MLEQNLVKYFEKSLQDHWDLEAFSNYHGETLTYSQVADRILFLHKFFAELGIKPQSKIAVIGKNSINWALTYLATVSYGATIVPILPDFHAADVHHIINHSGSVLLFSEDSKYEDLDIADMKKIKAVLSLRDLSLLEAEANIKKKYQTAEKTYLDEFEQNLTPEKLSFPDIPNHELAALVYTSGTTGFSKGVMLLHNSLISNIVYAQANMPLQAKDTIVSFLPIAHVFGCAFEFLFPFCSGCHITFLDKVPSPRVIIQAFSEIKPRLILSVPLVIEKIYRKQIKPSLQKGAVKTMRKIPGLRQIINKKVNQKLSVVFGENFREIVIGGASLNEEVEDFLREIGFRYTVGYGMTECAPLISYSSWNTFARGSVGRIVDQLEIKIDSSNPQTEVGEIMVRGANVTAGYYQNEEATRAALTDDGWLRTGDLGIVDAEGNIFIRGRSKSMILGASGKNIYPEEIEAKLSNMDYVSEALVIERQKQLVALIYPDYELADKNKVSDKELEKIMSQNHQNLNKILPGYMKVHKWEFTPTEFEKTPKKSIKRYLYMR
ncbi:MAG: AMP-binding protein [Candidatus Cloacimonadales bacterium]